MVRAVCGLIGRAHRRAHCVCVCACYLPFVSRADLNVVDHEEGTVGTAELLGALTSHGWVIDFRQQVCGVRVGLAALGCDGVPLAVVCRTHMSFSRCCCRAWTTNWYALVCVCHVWLSPVAVSPIPFQFKLRTGLWSTLDKELCSTKLLSRSGKLH